MTHSCKLYTVITFLQQNLERLQMSHFSESAQQDARDDIFFLLQGAQDGQKEYPAALAKGSAPLKMSSEMAHAMQDEMLQLEVWVKDG